MNESSGARCRPGWALAVLNRRSLWALLLALGCSRTPAPERTAGEKPAPADTHRDEPPHEELPTRVQLSDAVVRDAKIATAPVVRETLSATLPLPGEISADPDRSAQVASPIAGRIESVQMREGALVKKGDALLTIAVPDLGRLRSEQSAFVAQAKAARVNRDRLKELYEQRLASEQAYLDAVAQAESLEVQARAASDRLSALGLVGERASRATLTLRAPFGGTVVARKAVVGQPVNADQVLGEIVDLSRVWFLGRVFEKDLGRLTLDASAEVQLNAYPDLRFGGKIEYIGRKVDPVARTVTARISLENRDDLLRVGLFGTAYVALDSGERARASLVVPRSALTDIGGKQVVFVRHADRDFELHEVTLGASAEGKVQVLAGLREGEQVVIDGVFTLKSAVLKSTFAEEE